MGVLFGTMSLGQATPNLEFIAGARGAAATIFELIETVSIGVQIRSVVPKAGMNVRGK